MRSSRNEVASENGTGLAFRTASTNRPLLPVLHLGPALEKSRRNGAHMHTIAEIDNPNPTRAHSQVELLGLARIDPCSKRGLNDFIPDVLKLRGLGKPAEPSFIDCNKQRLASTPGSGNRLPELFLE